MGMLLKRIVLALPLLLFGCATFEPVNEMVEPTFVRVAPVSSLVAREVVITIDDNGDIVLTPKNYENLSKNLSDIYQNQKLLKENIRFYEGQMFTDEKKD